MAFAVFVLSGCNSWFGNDAVLRFDAKYFDTRIDAPSQCPAFGQPPPVFGTALHQQILQDCVDYTFNSGRASAVCHTPDGGLSAFEGPIDQPLSLVNELYEPNLATAVDEVALSSDAQTIYARHVDFDTGTPELRSARRSSDTTWQVLPLPALGQNPDDQVGTFAHGPTGDHTLIVASDLTVHEWVEDSDGWREARTHPFQQIGNAKMSADGLRVMVHTFDQHDYYSDRPDIDSLFGPPVPFLTAPPSGSAPMMTEDCGRLYVTGLQSVFYVQQ